MTTRFFEINLYPTLHIPFTKEGQACVDMLMDAIAVDTKYMDASPSIMFRRSNDINVRIVNIDEGSILEDKAAAEAEAERRDAAAAEATAAERDAA